MEKTFRKTPCRPKSAVHMGKVNKDEAGVYLVLRTTTNCYLKHIAGIWKKSIKQMFTVAVHNVHYHITLFYFKFVIIIMGTIMNCNKV